MVSEEKIRVAVHKLDIVTAPRLVAALERVIDLWPEARSFFEPGIDLLISAIRENQREERQRWRERN